MTRRLDIAVRDESRDVVGDVARWASATFTLRVNAPGEWTLVLPVLEGAADLLDQPGYGVVVDLDGERLMSGPVTSVQRSRDADGSYSVTVRGTDDLGALLLRSLAWPTPGAAIGSQVDDYHAVPAVGATPSTDDAETVIKAYVSSDAVSRLSLPGLSVATNLSRGSALRGTARYDQLGDLLPALAEQGGLILSVTFGHLDGSLLFDVAEPTDRTGEIILSDDMSNVASWDIVHTAPSATRVVVGGQGELAAREMRLVVDSAAEATWGVWEGFLDATDVELGNTVLLDARGAAWLAERGESWAVTAEAQDTPQMTYGVHYELGDLVTALGVADQVRQVEVTDTTEAGVVVRPTVGLPARADPLAYFASVVRDIRRQVASGQRKR